MNIQAIAFDLDDTLLRSDRTISAHTVRVLREAAERGIEIIPASGRARDSMKPFVEQLGCASMYISCNGAEVWSAKHELLHREALDVPMAREIARFGAQRDCYAQTYAGPRFFYSQKGRWAESYAESSMLTGVYVGDLEAYLTEPTSKILMMAEEGKIAHMLKEARAQFEGRASVCCSKPYFWNSIPCLQLRGWRSSFARRGQAFPWQIPRPLATVSTI